MNRMPVILWTLRHQGELPFDCARFAAIAKVNLARDESLAAGCLVLDAKLTLVATDGRMEILTASHPLEKAHLPDQPLALLATMVIGWKRDVIEPWMPALLIGVPRPQPQSENS